MSRMYISFINKGLLDYYGMMVMGATGKRGDTTKIGEYGTGLKYAIAVLSRNGVDMQVSVDQQEIPIQTRKQSIAGVEHNMIVINGIDAMFTDQMGPDWELWMAIREIYCNSIDEGSNAVNILNFDEVHRGKKGHTMVSINKTPAVDDIMRNWDNYFSFERTDDVLSIPGVKVFKKLPGNSHSTIYRKGVMVAKSKQVGCFDYDFDDIPINEIRQAKDFSYIEDSLKTLLKGSVSAQVLKAILESGNTWEKALPFYDWEYIAPAAKKVWKEVIGPRAIISNEFSDKLQGDRQEETLVRLPAMTSQLIAKQIDDVLVLGMDKGSHMHTMVKLHPEYSSKLDQAIGWVQKIADLDGVLFTTVDFQSDYIDSTHSFTGDADEILISRKYIQNKSIKEIALRLYSEFLLMASNNKAASLKWEEYLVEKLFEANHHWVALSSGQKAPDWTKESVAQTVLDDDLPF